MRTLPTAVEGPLSPVSMTTSAFSASAPSPLFFFFLFFTPPSWPLSLSLPPVKDMGSPLQPWVRGYVVVGEHQHHNKKARPTLHRGTHRLRCRSTKSDGLPKHCHSQRVEQWLNTSCIALSLQPHQQMRDHQ